LTINLLQSLQKRSLEWPDERLEVVLLLEGQYFKGDALLPVPFVDPNPFLDDPPFDQ